MAEALVVAGRVDRRRVVVWRTLARIQIVSTFQVVAAVHIARSERVGERRARIPRHRTVAARGTTGRIFVLVFI